MPARTAQARSDRLSDSLGTPGSRDVQVRVTMRRPAEVLLATAQATGGPGKTMLPLISPLPVAVYVYWTGQSTGRGFESRPPRCRMRSKMKQETLLDLGDVFIDVCAFDIYNKDYLLTYLLT